MISRMLVSIKFVICSKEVVDLVADDLYILRYNSVKPLIESGQIDLV